MTKTPRELEEEFGSSSFQRFPLTLVKGLGSTVWDNHGKQYTDCMAGYGVAITGHCNPWVVKAIRSQAEKLITCHGSFYNDVRAEFLEKLAKTSRGLESAILTNSGTEAVEAAIKLARRHTGRKGIVSMTGGFHGKTFGSLSATWNEKYREPFQPLLPEFDFAVYGNIEDLEAKVNDQTAAVIVEPIQGESGIIIPSPEYLPAVQDVCERKGALLILDEIQTGLGRTGLMWASEHWSVVPDIMTVSKGLGGGVPIGAAMTTPEIMKSLKTGEHTSTFAGNPLACAAASANLDFIAAQKLPSQADRKGTIFKTGLDAIARENKVVKEARGMGLMLALELNTDIHQLLLNAISRGVILAYAGKQTVRLLPPLVIDAPEIQKVLGVLKAVVVIEEGRKSLQDVTSRQDPDEDSEGET